jgi:ABC-2 type transport system ATP-binding protein
MPVAVSVKGVSKKYRIFPSGRARLKEALSFGRKKYSRDFWALKDIDLEVEPGTTLGILGRNGAGKSTLLSIIAGILQPTSGIVEVNGRLIALSSMGAGFNKEFTGRENIMLNGLILGMKRQEIMKRFDDIAAFADIGDFMDQPIKTYSSGMRSRLGFAVAVNVEPDVLILDETLAVGDAVYKETALQKMYELRDSGTTILFVSHSISQIDDFCTEAMLLHKGRVLAAGETTEITARYETLVSNIKRRKNRGRTDGAPPSDPVAIPEAKDPVLETGSGFERQMAHPHSGTGKARIRSVDLLDEHLRPVEVVAPDSNTTVRVYLECLEAVKASEVIITLCSEAGLGETEGQTERRESQFYGPNLGYVLELYERYGEDPESVDERTRRFFETWSPPGVEENGHAPVIAGELFSSSTGSEGVPMKEMEKGEQVAVDFTFKAPLQPGHYSVSIAASTGGKDLDRVDAATTFEVLRPQDRNPLKGLVHLPAQIKVHAPEGERQGRST